jgi:hypothetical protein
VRKSPLVKIIELYDDQSPDLETAQREALSAFAEDLAVTIRELLEAGVLIQKDEKIIPNPQKPC